MKPNQEKLNEQRKSTNQIKSQTQQANQQRATQGKANSKTPNEGKLNQERQLETSTQRPAPLGQDKSLGSSLESWWTDLASDLSNSGAVSQAETEHSEIPQKGETRPRANSQIRSSPLKPTTSQKSLSQWWGDLGVTLKSPHNSPKEKVQTSPSKKGSSPLSIPSSTPRKSFSPVSSASEKTMLSSSMENWWGDLGSELKSMDHSSPAPETPHPSTKDSQIDVNWSADSLNDSQLSKRTPDSGGSKSKPKPTPPRKDHTRSKIAPAEEARDPDRSRIIKRHGSVSSYDRSSPERFSSGQSPPDQAIQDRRTYFQKHQRHSSFNRNLPEDDPRFQDNPERFEPRSDPKHDIYPWEMASTTSLETIEVPSDHSISRRSSVSIDYESSDWEDTMFSSTPRIRRLKDPKPSAKETTESSLTMIKEYQIVKKIGGGGFASVYSGVHITQGHTVAIKKFTNVEPSSYKAIMAEVRLLKELKHPHIVKYIDQYEANDQYYIIMEYVEKSLSTMLEGMSIFQATFIYQRKNKSILASF